MKTIHTHINRLATLLLVTTAAVGCDVEDKDTQQEFEAIAQAETPQPITDIDIDITDALVSITPDVIEGLEPVGYDEERAVYVYDRDGDGWPDISEELANTDMFDPESSPVSDLTTPFPANGFPNATCRANFRQAGSRLCISTYTQNATDYRYASSNCRNQLSHVCTYEDLTYLYLNSNLDATYNPNGKHLGGMTGDDQILCGNATITSDNDPDWGNFDGHCSKTGSRPYWCCHDDNG